MKYYIANNGQQFGPFDVKDLLANGLNQSSLVWCEGMVNWMPATQVPEVSQLFNQVPPAVPPTQPQQQPYQPQGYQQQQQYQQGYQPQYQPQGYQQCRQSMGFGEAIKVCFSKFADFDGRASQAEFWWFFLFTIIVSFVTYGFGCIVTLLPSLAVGSRRLHDTGHSGWFQLLSIVPIVGLILIYWFAINGDEGNNMYGPQPLK